MLLSYQHMYALVCVYICMHILGVSTEPRNSQILPGKTEDNQIQTTAVKYIDTHVHIHRKSVGKAPKSTLLLILSYASAE